MLLYVINDHPSLSETFAVAEAAAVTRLGCPVMCYALKVGEAQEPAAKVDLIRKPPSRRRLVRLVLSNLSVIRTTLWRTRRFRLSVGEMARVVLAEAHAAHIADACRRYGVTHVHAHFLARASDVAMALSPKLNCSWTATAHGGDVYAPGEPALLQRRLDDVSGVACANTGLRDRILGRPSVKVVPTQIVHCGIDTEVLSFPISTVVKTPHHLVTIGRLVATKGHRTILESAVTLLTHDPTLRWTIIGGGPLHDELTSDPRYLRLAPRLHYAGAMTHNQALAVLRDATAFVMPCERGPHGDSDGIPVALMEAMALGVPVITTAVGGIPELVLPGETGVIIPPTDALALTRAVERLFSAIDAGSLDGLRRAARQKIEQDFDIVQEAAKLLGFLRSYLDLEPASIALTPAERS